MFYHQGSQPELDFSNCEHSLEMHLPFECICFKYIYCNQGTLWSDWITFCLIFKVRRLLLLFSLIVSFDNLLGEGSVVGTH